jgi:hypothetical protein
MPNEFVARNGIIALNNSSITGSLNVTSSAVSTIAGNPTFDGDSILTIKNNNPSSFPTQVLALDSVRSDTPVDIKLGSSTPKGIRIYADNQVLTSSPAGAGFQFYRITDTNFPGQVYFDSGAHNNAAIIFRTAITSGTITERARFTSAGRLLIGTTTESTFELDVVGDIRSTLDARINGLTVGKGNGSVATNTAFGTSALNAVSGNHNTGIGASALSLTSTGTQNTAVGTYALINNSTASNQTALGYDALSAATTSGNNTAVGNRAGKNTTGASNIFVGDRAGFDVTSGTYNTIIGSVVTAGTLYGITTGSYNTIIGSQITGLSSSLSNTIILADGQGNQRLYINNSGNVGIGTTSPNARLDVNGPTIITGSLTVTQGITGSLLGTASLATTASNALTASFVQNAISASFASTASFVNPLRQDVQITGSLSVSGSILLNGTGSVIGSGTTNYVPKWTSSTALGDSLISDNSTLGNVGINTASPASTLELYKATGTNYLYITNAAASSNNGVVLRYLGVDYMGMIGNFFTGELKIGGFNASSFFPTFYSNNAERMRLTPSGRLLIGTSTESTFLLDVNGTSRFTNNMLVTGSVTATSFTGSLSGSATSATSASFAATASSADNFLVRGTLTAQTIVAQTITSSTDFVTGSTRFGSLSSNTHQFTGSVSITGSLTANGNTTISGSTVISGSFTVFTGSAVEFQVTNTGVRIGNVTADVHTVTGSLNVSGSTIIVGNTRITGSLNVNAENNNISFYNAAGSQFIGSMGRNSAGSLNVQADLADLRLGVGGFAGNIVLDSTARAAALIRLVSTSGTIVSSSFTVFTGSAVEFQVTNTGVRIGNASTDTHTVTGSFNISGSGFVHGGGFIVSGTLATSGSTSQGLVAPLKFTTATANTNYTLVYTDEGKMVEMSNIADAPLLVTIPLNSSVPFPIGTEISIIQIGGGTTIITGSSGVTVNSSLGVKTLQNPYDVASVVKRGTDSWYLFGNLS